MMIVIVAIIFIINSKNSFTGIVKLTKVRRSDCLVEGYVNYPVYNWFS